MIEGLSFEQKLNLLKELIDDLDITLTAHYGAEGYMRSRDVTVKDEQITIWTGINTG
jgi:hypothetical protein